MNEKKDEKTKANGCYILFNNFLIKYLTYPLIIILFVIYLFQNNKNDLFHNNYFWFVLLYLFLTCSILYSDSYLLQKITIITNINQKKSQFLKFKKNKFLQKRSLCSQQ